MKVLLTFVGSNDPFGTSAVDGVVSLGPALALVEDLRPDVVCLIETRSLQENNDATAQELASRFPDCKVERIPCYINDPTNHFAILNQLREISAELSSNYPGAVFSAGLTSGTASMHACMLLLAASGEIQANVFQSLNPKYQDEGARLVRELDFSDPAFPTIQPFKELEYLEVDDWRIVAKDVGICGNDPKFSNQLKRAAIVAKHPNDVLIVGENGTGKDLMANFIHLCSERASSRMIAFNAASTPKDRVEADLFGYKKGAFTGATRDHDGFFQSAEGSTIFIDELGEMDSSVQAKLLRALENKMIQPLGMNEQKVDVRVIAATNVNVSEAIQNGSFRQDLFHRFTTVIELPPLRERPSDLPDLAAAILADYNRDRSPSREKKRLSKKALKKLAGFHWPGNIRQLKNVLENAAIFSSNNLIGPDDIQFDSVLGSNGFEGLPEPVEGFKLKEYQAEVRSRLIRRAVELEGGKIEGDRLIGCKQVDIAKRLGISNQAINQEFLKNNES